MPDEFKWGFKAGCEQIAKDTRFELNLAVAVPLDACRLAQHLDIPVMPITALSEFGAHQRHLDVLLNAGRGLSAFTVVRGTYRAIFYNPAHPRTRRSKSLAHELSHVLLEHQPTIAIVDGLRNWNRVDESEADWLAATLLVPRDGAFRWLRDGGTIGGGAQHFCVSDELFQWRARQTGIIRQLGLAR